MSEDDGTDIISCIVALFIVAGLSILAGGVLVKMAVDIFRWAVR